MMRDNTFKEHHHADDSNIVVGSEGLDTDAFFRFIQGHMSGGGWGVSGIEDDDWEYTVSAADHNEYLGKSFEPKTYQQITPFTSIGTTMTAYCCGCHGVFHYEKDASNNWIRHPSDAVLPDSGEFDLYTIFNPDAPVARPATSATRDDFVNWSAADSEVVPGEDFVMCLSCHRAHGSPYPKMLRWDPTAADACVACHTVKVSETQGQYHYTGVADCNVCHAHHGEGPPNYVETGNLGLIDNVISTPISGDKAVTFPSGGASDYISDASPWEGVCQVCHTDTDYYQNNGTSPGGTHNAGSDCTTCHIHEGEFLHGGDCETCHGHDAGYEYEPGKFSEGAGTYKSHSTHSENDSDDLMGPNITCGDCHDTNNYPNFKDGQPLETTTACDDCHSPGGHFDGVDAAAVGAKNNWAAGVYNGAGDDLEAGKEQWCATCHDDASDTDTNESALIDGVYAPGIAGVYATPDVTWYSPASVSGPPGFQWMIDDDTGTANTSLFTQAVFDLGSDYLITDIRMYVKDAPDGIIWQVFALNGSNWTRVLGADNPFYSWKTGHSGAGWYQAKLDVSVTARYLRIAKSVGPCFPGTVFEVQYKKDNLSYGYFETGHGIKCSNCHDFSKAHIDGEPRTYAASADNHQEGYRLKLANVVPRDGVGVASADFALCLNCHADEGLVNRDNMTATNFRDDGENVNDHFRHLMDAGGLYFDSDFDGVADSCMTCTSCHNVHGSPTPAMIRHGELINHVPGLNLRYINTTTGEPDGYILGAYPDSSGAETHFWGTGSGSISKNGICNMCHNDAIRYMRSPLNLTMPDPAGFGVITLCPVDLRVIDPDGLIVDKVLNEIDGASYFEGDIDGDGSIDDRIIIPVRKVGEYIVLVLPEPNPDPDDKDTYTLKAMVSNETMLLAEDVPIVPPDSEDEYTVISTESGISTEDSSAAIITVVDGDGNDSGVGTNSSASNTSSASGNGNCFIATAAFGSYADPHVQVLRDFRDEYLLTNMPGRWFVSTYYTYGPFWADRLNTHNGCKPIVRLSLMPLVGLSYFMLKASLATKLLAGFVIMGFVMSCLLWIHGRSVTRKAVFAGG
jgi:predicted CXXCH cytochrome family protein